MALGLVLVKYVPATAAGASFAILVAAKELGLVLSCLWAAALGQSVVSAVLGIFAGFWLSYSALVLGLTHNWFGVTAADAVKTQELFLIAWTVTISLLTVATPRLPLAFTVLFALVGLALILVLIATANTSSATDVAGEVGRAQPRSRGRARQPNAGQRRSWSPAQVAMPAPVTLALVSRLAVRSVVGSS